MGQAPKGGISMYTLFGWLLLFLAAAYSDGGGAGWLPLACIGLVLMICGQRKKLPATRQRRKQQARENKLDASLLYRTRKPGARG